MQALAQVPVQAMALELAQVQVQVPAQVLAALEQVQA